MALKVHGFLSPEQANGSCICLLANSRLQSSVKKCSWVQKIGDSTHIVISETKHYYLLIWLFIWITEMEREQEMSRWEPSNLCLLTASGDTQHWLHVTPGVFQPTSITECRSCSSRQGPGEAKSCRSIQCSGSDSWCLSVPSFAEVELVGLGDLHRKHLPYPRDIAVESELPV